jgi:hypothetical protein
MTQLVLIGKKESGKKEPESFYTPGMRQADPPIRSK